MDYVIGLSPNIESNFSHVHLILCLLNLPMVGFPGVLSLSLYLSIYLSLSLYLSILCLLNLPMVGFPGVLSLPLSLSFSISLSIYLSISRPSLSCPLTLSLSHCFYPSIIFFSHVFPFFVFYSLFVHTSLTVLRLVFQPIVCTRSFSDKTNQKVSHFEIFFPTYTKISMT